jgi:Uma2 family endonuclease
MTALTLNLQPALEVTDREFEQICTANRDLRIERSHQGELIIMPPTGGETGRRNLGIGAQLWVWNQSTRLGEAFDSSTGFRLPSGAIKSPDVAWVTNARWQALTAEQRRKYIPLCPDFAIELRSATDDLRDIQAKMREYLQNGMLLGWLIDPESRTVEIYRPEQAVEVLQSPRNLFGENVLVGFSLDLAGIIS